MKAKSILGAIRDSIVLQADRIASTTDAAMDIIARGTVPPIPLFSASVKSLQFRDAVARRRYERNVEAFIEAVAKAPDRVTIEEAIEQIAGDTHAAEDFVDTLMQVLTDGEKPVKSEVVGRLFASFADGKISYNQMRTLMLVVLRASVPALESLPLFMRESRKRKGKNRHEVPQEVLLYSAGLGSRYRDSFKLSELGTLLSEHGFGETPIVPGVG